MKGNTPSPIFTALQRIICLFGTAITCGHAVQIFMRSVQLGASSLLHRDSGWRLYDPNKQIDNDFKSDQQIQLLKKQYQESCPWFGSTLSCCIGGQCRFFGSQIKGKAQGRRSLQTSGPSALEPAQIRFALSLQVYKSYSKTCLFPWVFSAYMRYFNLCIGFMSSMLVVWCQMDAGPCQDVVPLLLTWQWFINHGGNIMGIKVYYGLILSGFLCLFKGNPNCL